MTLTMDMAWEAMAASDGIRGVPLLRSGCRRNAERVRHLARAASTANAHGVSWIAGGCFGNLERGGRYQSYLLCCTRLARLVA